MRLMIVDDSNTIRSRILRIVRKYKDSNIEIVGLAPDGQQALQIARKALPDVVTMDLTMPQMDGIEAISRLIQLNPDIKILVVSALDDKATAIVALRLGACGFLPKPFTDEELMLALLDVSEVT
ncbi:response regulator transcription factor [Saezia sanguinis]|jgi:two-component system chemotaxis response regulator CheY|uniref:response regulator transcription factor n=1 Tax=Saezia sanguinis TaxID=1965230 RepID=UPI00305B18AD